MNQSWRTARVGIVATVVAFALLGCSWLDGGSGSGPAFDGVETVTANGLTRVTLSWQAATDDDTAPDDIRYEIWQADVDSISTTTSPVLTTAPGMTSAQVTVPGFREQFFLLQALDEAGNRDGNTRVVSLTTTQGTWNRIDGGGENGVNETSMEQTYPVLESLGGELYVAWPDSSAGELRVYRYDGDGTTGDWSAVDGGGVSVNSTVLAETPSLRAYQGRLYAAWTELLDNGNSSFSQQLRVAVYDPENPSDGWTLVDENAVGGLNRDPEAQADGVHLAVTNGTLFAVWGEGSLSTGLYAASYNGDDAAPAWTDLGGDLKYGVGTIPRDPDAVGYDNDLVVVWDEGSTIRAKVYDPVLDTWSQYEGSGTGLNYDAGSSAYSPRVAVVGGELYLVWTEDDDSFNVQVRARVREGADWTLIDGGGATGLNYNTSLEGVLDAVSPFGVNGVLYVAFAEKDSGDVARLRVLAYNGDTASPAWQFVDGATSGGLTASSTYEAEFPAAAGHNGELIVAWAEQIGAVAVFYDVRVIRGR